MAQESYWEVGYPYVLGCHIASGLLCRIFRGPIAPGYVRVVNYRPYVGGPRIFPYGRDGELQPRYWSIVRDVDIERHAKV